MIESNKRLFASGINNIQTRLNVVFEDIANCFYLSKEIIMANETKIALFLKEHAKFFIMVKCLFLQIKHDAIKIEEMGWDKYTMNIPEISILKPKINKSEQDRPQLNEKFETTEVFTGNSAFFDSISYSLFKSTEYSRMLRLITLVKYFENIKTFSKIFKFDW